MSGRSQSVRFVSGRTHRDASDRIPDDALVTQNGFIGGVQDDALSRSQTIASYLQDGTDVLRQKSWRDTLRAGSAADLIALEQDPFDSPIDLRSVKTLMTVVRETIGHDALGSQHFNAARVFN